MKAVFIFKLQITKSKRKSETDFMKTIRDRIREIEEAETENFVELTKISGLDPANDFRNMNMRDMDLSNCDLAGYDFRGSNINGINWENADIKGTLFDKEQIEQLRKKGHQFAQDYNFFTKPDFNIIEACLLNLFEVVRELLEMGENANLTENDGTTPLIISCDKGNNHICELLLRYGADANKYAMPNGETPLTIASAKGHMQIVRLLIDNGADVNLVRKNDGWTPLMVATEEENKDLVEYLLDKGAGVNHRDPISVWTALMVACAGGNEEIVELLLNHGAAVNRDTLENSGTVLMAASAGGFVPVVELLINHKARVNEQRTDTGETALIVAAARGHEQVVKILIDNGAELNLIEQNDKTALDYSLEQGHLEISTILKGAGAKRGDEL